MYIFGYNSKRSKSYSITFMTSFYKRLMPWKSLLKVIYVHLMETLEATPFLTYYHESENKQQKDTHYSAYDVKKLCNALYSGINIKGKPYGKDDTKHKTHFSSSFEKPNKAVI